MCQAPPLPEEAPHGRRAPSAERGAQPLTARGRPGGLAVPGAGLAAWPRRAEPCSHAGPAVSLAAGGGGNGALPPRQDTGTRATQPPPPCKPESGGGDRASFPRP
ncbi:hypothetical protein KIL84_014190 [Mauremys mutica]|uniref:Uncharacterized protein n=1 Tax=Mauremys mutica TaxID=74926 RepID=A0A9D3XMZ2_9SAUR|nr:hypothetical protein KIL84_014190 [Mauremys mutica]